MQNHLAIGASMPKGPKQYLFYFSTLPLVSKLIENYEILHMNDVVSPIQKGESTMDRLDIHWTIWAIVEVDDLGFWAMTLQRFDERATNCPCSSQSTCSQSPSLPSRQEGWRGPSLPHLRRAFLNGFIEWLEILHGNENLSSHLKVENLADKLDAHHIIQEIVEGDGMTLNSGSDTTMLQ